MNDLMSSIKSGPNEEQKKLL